MPAQQLDKLSISDQSTSFFIDRIYGLYLKKDIHWCLASIDASFVYEVVSQVFYWCAGIIGISAGLRYLKSDRKKNSKISFPKDRGISKYLTPSPDDPKKPIDSKDNFSDGESNKYQEFYFPTYDRNEFLH